MKIILVDWQRIFDTFPSNFTKGDGFSIRLYQRFGLRYYEADRELTLMTGEEDATDRYGRSLLVLPTYETLIFVPNVLKWDHGESLTERESALVIERICHAYQERKTRYRVVVGDEIYEQIARDAEQAEKVKR
jgi:hypothetical protein